MFQQRTPYRKTVKSEMPPDCRAACKVVGAICSCKTHASVKQTMGAPAAHFQVQQAQRRHARRTLDTSPSGKEDATEASGAAAAAEGGPLRRHWWRLQARSGGRDGDGSSAADLQALQARQPCKAACACPTAASHAYTAMFSFAPLSLLPGEAAPA